MRDAASSVQQGRQVRLPLTVLGGNNRIVMRECIEGLKTGLSAHVWLAHSGIMNGLDTVEWDPAADEWLPAAARFHAAEDAARGKAEAKRELQMRTGLAIDPKVGLGQLGYWFNCILPKDCLGQQVVSHIRTA